MTLNTFLTLVCGAAAAGIVVVQEAKQAPAPPAPAPIVAAVDDPILPAVTAVEEAKVDRVLDSMAGLERGLVVAPAASGDEVDEARRRWSDRLSEARAAGAERATKPSTGGGAKRRAGEKKKRKAERRRARQEQVQRRKHNRERQRAERNRRTIFERGRTRLQHNNDYRLRKGYRRVPKVPGSNRR